MAPAETKGEVKDKGKKPKETPAVGKAEGPADLAEMARQNVKQLEAANDFAMAAKGGSLFNCKIWKFRNIAEARLIILDPIVQPAHFEKLREFIELNIRGKAFTEATVGYSPGDGFGHSAGDFWLMSMRVK